MSRSLFVASTFVALSGTLVVFAAQKAGPDPVGPTELNQKGGQRPAVVRPAQVAPQTAPQTAPQAAQPGQWSNPDHALATCVATSNQLEISIGQFAMEKSQNDDVKKFASMLVADHKEFLQKIRQFAPEASQSGFLTQLDNREVRTNNSKSPNRATAGSDVQPVAATEDAAATPRVQTAVGTQPASPAHREFSHLQLGRELAQQCLASTKEKLGAKSDAEFDKCFIGQQIGMHMQMKDTLIVYQRHASRELGQILAAGQQKTEEHLAKAEELMKKLEHGSATTAASGNTKARDAAKATTAKE